MFQRPDLGTLIARISSDIETHLSGSNAHLRRQVLNVLARAMAGAAHGMHGRLEDLSQQILPDTADAERLERWASIWGILRKPAALASGNITLTGTDASVVAAGTLLQRADGAEFVTLAEVVIAAGEAVAVVEAVAGGEEGNTDAGETLTLVNPIAGVDSETTVDVDGLTGGSDRESDDDLRERLLARLQQPPHGGSAHDYVAWALEVPLVTRAWCFPLARGNGTVDVYLVTDDEVSIIPDAAKVQEVQDYIDDLRPVTADFLAKAPTAVAIDFTININPAGDATVQAAVQAELKDMLSRDAEPEDGNGSGTILLSHIREAISTAAGEIDHVLSAPAADVALNEGEIAVMGVITWA